MEKRQRLIKIRMANNEIKRIYWILAVMLVLLLTLFCGCGGKLKAQDVKGVKSKIQSLGLETSNMRSLSTAGISDMYCIINCSWTFLFYDYGTGKKQLDEMMAYLVPTMDSMTKTKRANYEIYEMESDINYVLYVRVDNTLMCVIGPKEQKEKLRSFMRDMGYYP